MVAHCVSICLSVNPVQPEGAFMPAQVIADESWSFLRILRRVSEILTMQFFAHLIFAQRCGAMPVFA